MMLMYVMFREIETDVVVGKFEVMATSFEEAARKAIAMYDNIKLDSEPLVEDLEIKVSTSKIYA